MKLIKMTFQFHTQKTATMKAKPTLHFWNGNFIPIKTLELQAESREFRENKKKTFLWLLFNSECVSFVWHTKLFKCAENERGRGHGIKKWISLILLCYSLFCSWFSLRRLLMRLHFSLPHSLSCTPTYCCSYMISLSLSPSLLRLNNNKTKKKNSTGKWERPRGDWMGIKVIFVIYIPPISIFINQYEHTRFLLYIDTKFDALCMPRWQSPSGLLCVGTENTKNFFQFAIKLSCIIFACANLTK